MLDYLRPFAQIVELPRRTLLVVVDRIAEPHNVERRMCIRQPLVDLMRMNDRNIAWVVESVVGKI